MITMKDIAKACGVSISLVSRIINKDETLKCRQETIDKVLKEIEKTGYTPNTNARMLATNSLVSKRTIRIGYLTYKGIKGNSNLYFDNIAEGLSTIFLEEKFEVYKFYIDEVYAKYEKKEPLTSKILDGLVIFGTIPNNLYNYLKHQSKYISCIYGKSFPNCDSVGTDINVSLNPMLSLIKEYGYEEVALVYGEEEGRIKHIKEYANSIGLTINENFSFDGGYNEVNAYEKACLLLKKYKPPKVICCLNDEMAIGIENALIKHGYNVPNDVSVTGHDDVYKASYCKVPLTTIRIYKEEIGRLISDLLIERITYFRKFPVNVIVPCEIVLRDSLKKNK